MATTDAVTERSRIFISYRREDSDIWVGRLADELRKHFPTQAIFVDIASIDPGADFVTALEQALASAAAMLVVIGPRWLSATDRQGRKRLDNPTDFVRLEIAESLRCAGVRVFPLLVNGADMPADEDLPEPLKPLARRQAFDLTVRHWANDVTQFVVALKGVPGLSGRGAIEGAEATARFRAEQEAQRHEAERAAKEAAQLAAAEEVRRRADEETRRKAAEDASRKTEAEKTSRLRAEQEAQRHEAERAAKDEAQLAAAKEARRRADEETRRKAANSYGSAEGEVQRRAAEEAVPRGAEASHARPVLRKVVAIGGIIAVTALAVFFIGRRPDTPVASVAPPASSSPPAGFITPSALEEGQSTTDSAPVTRPHSSPAPKPSSAADDAAKAKLESLRRKVEQNTTYSSAALGGIPIFGDDRHRIAARLDEIGIRSLRQKTSVQKRKFVLSCSDITEDELQALEAFLAIAPPLLRDRQHELQANCSGGRNYMEIWVPTLGASGR